MHRRNWGFIFGIVALLAFDFEAAEPTVPLLFQSDGKSLAQVKERTAGGGQSLKVALDSLLSQADKDLQTKPWTIVHKPKVPPSGDVHDYVSLAPYFWPDPKKKDG